MSLYKKSEIPEHLQKYFEPAEIGLEQTPEEYVNQLVNVFREVKRVLRDDGTLWLNLGDSYASGKGSCFNPGGWENSLGKERKEAGAHPLNRGNKSDLTRAGLKPKDLIGIPWRVAFALQADGWYLRQDIIWSKNNPMPESVKDRCTKSHEYMFLFSKSAKYFYDNDSIREPAQDRPYDKSKKIERDPTGMIMGNAHNYAPGASGYGHHPNGRNKRSVWQINTKPYKGAHFATFPPSLVEPCIKAGTSEYGVCSVCGSPFKRITKVIGKSMQKWSHSDYAECRQETKNGSGDKGLRTGLVNVKNTVVWEPVCSCNAPVCPATVIDPFGGSGTVGEVCNKLNRNAILIELNPEYKPLILERTGRSLANF